MKALPLILLMALSFSLAAEEHYPKVPIRYFGSNQGPVGDCMAQADVNALEHAFAQRDYPVKLSLFYRHARVWQTLAWQKYQKDNLTYSPEDIRLLDKTGAIIPEYMWPESEEENDTFHGWPARVRPTVSQQALIDPQFPTAESLGFVKQEFPVSVDELKKHVRNNEAVVLSVQADILGQVDPGSGFSNAPYEQYSAQFRDKEIDHAIAIVGFDDSLNGFIVRNSWNTPSNYDTSWMVGRGRKLDLYKFRLRISEKNLPGYQILPYAYVADLARFNRPFRVFQLNYDAYAAAYLQFEKKYRTVAAPFFCFKPEADDRGHLKVLSNFLVANILGDPPKDRASTADELKSQRQLMNIYLREATRMAFIFRLAKLPATTTDTSRVDKFFDGAYKAYYCGTDTQWPSTGFNEYRRNRAIDDTLYALGAGESTVSIWKQWFHKLIMFM